MPTRDKPLISIVTVVFNGEKFLEETILSVINQTYDNVEYIIIDGGSSDGTLDIIKKYEDRVDYWVSEKDSGIYDAMNKGIDVASGEWINFMNAGDSFVHNTVLEKVFYEKKYENTTLLYGNKITNNVIEMPFPLKVLEYGVIMACHQAMFFNKKILKNNLNYDLNYPIYSDYELVNKIYLIYPSTLKYVNVLIAHFEGGGISSVISTQKRKDKYKIVYKYYGILGLLKSVLKRIFR